MESVSHYKLIESIDNVNKLTTAQCIQYYTLLTLENNELKKDHNSLKFITNVAHLVKRINAIETYYPAPIYLSKHLFHTYMRKVKCTFINMLIGIMLFKPTTLSINTDLYVYFKPDSVSYNEIVAVNNTLYYIKNEIDSCTYARLIYIIVQYSVALIKHICKTKHIDIFDAEIGSFVSDLKNVENVSKTIDAITCLNEIKNSYNDIKNNRFHNSNSVFWYSFNKYCGHNFGPYTYFVVCNKQLMYGKRLKKTNKFVKLVYALPDEMLMSMSTHIEDHVAYCEKPASIVRTIIKAKDRLLVKN